MCMEKYFSYIYVQLFCPALMDLRNTTLRTMRESLANQVYQEDQHQVPSIFSQALRIKRLKSISFLRS